MEPHCQLTHEDAKFMMKPWWLHEMPDDKTKPPFVFQKGEFSSHKIPLLLVLKKAAKGIMNIRYLSNMRRIFAKCFMKAIDVISNACPGQVDNLPPSVGVWWLRIWGAQCFFFDKFCWFFYKKVGENVRIFCFLLWICWLFGGTRQIFGLTKLGINKKKKKTYGSDQGQIPQVGPLPRIPSIKWQLS